MACILKSFFNLTFWVLQDEFVVWDGGHCQCNDSWTRLGTEQDANMATKNHYVQQKTPECTFSSATCFSEQSFWCFLWCCRCCWFLSLKKQSKQTNDDVSPRTQLQQGLHFDDLCHVEVRQLPSAGIHHGPGAWQRSMAKRFEVSKTAEASTGGFWWIFFWRKAPDIVEWKVFESKPVLKACWTRQTMKTQPPCSLKMMHSNDYKSIPTTQSYSTDDLHVCGPNFPDTKDSDFSSANNIWSLSYSDSNPPTRRSVFLWTIPTTSC